MEEFEVGGHRYRADKIDARKQFHVARRVAPILAPAAKAFRMFTPSALPAAAQPETAEPAPAGTEAAPTASAEDEASRNADIVAAMGPIATAFAELSDTDVDYVLDALLSGVKRDSYGKWVPFWNAQAKRQQFDDIDMGELMTIAANALVVNLGPFLRGALQNMSGPPKA